MKYVPDKGKTAFTTDLKTSYQAPDEKKALVVLNQVDTKYPNALKCQK